MNNRLSPVPRQFLELDCAEESKLLLSKKSKAYSLFFYFNINPFACISKSIEIDENSRIHKHRFKTTTCVYNQIHAWNQCKDYQQSNKILRCIGCTINCLLHPSRRQLLFPASQACYLGVLSCLYLPRTESNNIYNLRQFYSLLAAVKCSKSGSEPVWPTSSLEDRRPLVFVVHCCQINFIYCRQKLLVANI